MINVRKAIGKLELFAEKAQRLENTRFTQRMLGEPTGISLTLDGAGGSLIRNGPDSDDIDVVVLTWRFFTQPRDGVSLLRIEALLTGLRDDGLIDPKWVTKWATARAEIDGYLDARFEFDIALSVQHLDGSVLSNQDLTHRQLLELIIYGDLAHANDEYVEQVRRWKAGDQYEFLLNDFTEIMFQWVNFTRWLRRQVIEPVLAELSDTVGLIVPHPK